RYVDREELRRRHAAVFAAIGHLDFNIGDPGCDAVFRRHPVDHAERRDGHAGRRFKQREYKIGAIVGVFCVSDLDAVLIRHILAGGGNRHGGDHWRRVCRGNGNRKILYGRRGAIFTAIADTHADILGDVRGCRRPADHTGCRDGHAGGRLQQFKRQVDAIVAVVRVGYYEGVLIGVAAHSGDRRSGGDDRRIVNRGHRYGEGLLGGLGAIFATIAHLHAHRGAADALGRCPANQASRGNSHARRRGQQAPDQSGAVVGVVRVLRSQLVLVQHVFGGRGKRYRRDGWRHIGGGRVSTIINDRLVNDRVAIRTR